MKPLAESIILQCIEDLWDRISMRQSAEFFSRGGFSICANIAGMDIGDQVKLLELVNRSICFHKSKPDPAGILDYGWHWHGITSPGNHASLYL